MGLLQDKRALINGIASERPIASGIAEAMHHEGAQLAFACQNGKLKTRAEKAVAESGSDIALRTKKPGNAGLFGVLGKRLRAALPTPRP